MNRHVNIKQREYDRLYKEMDDLYHAVAKEEGLSDSALIIFYEIYELGDGCLQKEICERAFVSKQTIHSSIHNLERDGYLRLEKSNGRDRRIHLTTNGEKLVNEKVVPIICAENAVFEEMTEKETDELLRLSAKYLCILRQKLADRTHITDPDYFSHGS